MHLPSLPRPRLSTEERFKRAAEARARPARELVDEAIKKRLLILDVSHDIRRQDLALFLAQGQTLVNVIEHTGDLRLLMSGWNVEGDVAHIYNHWELVGGADALLRVELKLPDNPTYARFDSYMLAETKNIVTPVPRATGIPITDAARARSRLVFVRTTFKVRPQDWAELQARLESSMERFALENGWFLGDTFVGLTGDASTIVQVWAVPEASAERVQPRLAGTAWSPLLETVPACEVLQPAPSCPVLGRRASLPGPTALPEPREQAQQAAE